MLRLFALILCALAAATLNWDAPAHAAAPAATEQRLQRITIRTVGTGPMSVVFIPGLASPSSVFDAAAAKMKRGDRLVFVQINGCAGSKPGTAPLGNLIPGAVDELAAWMKANDIGPAAVIGHSMGGLMALMLASRHPEETSRLLIVDSLPFYGMLFGPTATPDTVRPIVEQMRAGLVSGTAPLAVPPHMSNNEANRAKILTWLKASDRKTVGEALVEDATTDIRPELPSIKVPVMVLYAVAKPEDKAMAEALYASAYKTLPNYLLNAVEDSEHFIMLDQPKVFDDEVRYFLR
jgi:pimeloyl-ACP methyl ester carboxylesterase